MKKLVGLFQGLSYAMSKLLEFTAGSEKERAGGLRTGSSAGPLTISENMDFGQSETVALVISENYTFRKLLLTCPPKADPDCMLVAGLVSEVTGGISLTIDIISSS